MAAVSVSAETRAAILRELEDIVQGSRSRALQEAYVKGRTEGANEMLGYVTDYAQVFLIENESLNNFVIELQALVKAIA